MLTAVDHLVLAVSDVALAVKTFRNLGFAVSHGGIADDAVGPAAYATFGDFYFEFREAEGARPDGRVGKAEASHGLVLRSDDLDADAARLRSDGFALSIPGDHAMSAREGAPSPRMAAVDLSIPVGLVERPATAQAGPVSGSSAIAHPNTATVVERVYFAVESIDRELERFERLLGIPAPEPELGTVIMSLMSVFYLGGIGIAVAEPRGPGPTASALSDNGPGLFQVLLRAEGLDTAAAVMVDNGLPPPTRGTRLSGESALLVEPAQACGLFVALAGPA